MITPESLGAEAASLWLLEKQAVRVRRGRSGRNCKGGDMVKQLDAAGRPHQDAKGVLSYPRGRKV